MSLQWFRYESNETPMQQYLNAHHALNKERALALQGGLKGPRIMVSSLPPSAPNPHLLPTFAMRPPSFVKFKKIAAMPYGLMMCSSTASEPVPQPHSPQMQICVAAGDAQAYGLWQGLALSLVDPLLCRSLDQQTRARVLYADFLPTMQCAALPAQS